MAHSLSAKKRIRQNEKRRIRNKMRQGALRKRVRKVTDALTHKHAEEAETAFRDACKLLDREADRGLIHRKAAARRKSRLQRKINQLKSAGAS